jgi:hypothetical protein
VGTAEKLGVWCFGRTGLLYTEVREGVSGEEILPRGFEGCVGICRWRKRGRDTLHRSVNKKSLWSLSVGRVRRL